MSLLNACKKDENGTLFIDGRVLEEPGNTPVPGVSVTLLQQNLDGGTFSSAYVPVNTVITNSSGVFAFEFERSNTSSYKLEFRKSLYFEKDLNINPDNIQIGNPYSTTQYMQPKAWVSTRLYNDLPQNELDLIEFNYSNASFECACCNNNRLELYGTTVDTSFICALPGGYELSYLVNVTKDTSDLFLLESIVCPKFDTTYINVGY